MAHNRRTFLKTAAVATSAALPSPAVPQAQEFPSLPKLREAHRNLDGQGFSKRWFQVAAETWEDVRNVDAALEGVTPLASAAALYRETTRLQRATEKRPTAFRASVVGALETLTYCGRPVESIPEFRLTSDVLKQFELLVLPEVDVLSSRHAEVIRRHHRERRPGAPRVSITS